MAAEGRGCGGQAVCGGWDAVAAAEADEGTDEEEEERERELEANNKRFEECVELQMQIHLSHAERCNLLRATALQLSQGNGVGANNLVLCCICGSEPVLRPPV